MAPKPRKDSAPSVQPEDYTQDVLVVASVPSCRLQLGLLASPALAAPELLQDAAAAPTLHLELHYSTAPVPVVSPPLTLEPDFTLLCNVEHMFRHKKGSDVIDRLINSSLELRLCNSSSKAVLATAAVDLLSFGLGSSRIEDGALPWQPVTTDEPFKVLHGSTAALSVVLKHQPCPAVPVPVPSTSSSGGATGAAAAAAAAAAAQAAAAAALQAALEPFCPLSPEEAAGCNILQFSAVSAAPLPANWATAAHAAAGGLACTLQLHLPSLAGRPVLGVKCAGGCSNGAQLEWPRQQQSCRVHLSAAATGVLKAHLELGQPLLLEVARYLTGPAADTATDPAFAAYHALLQFSAAAEQLQELGAVSAAGVAVPVGAMSWAVQQGKVSAATLPAASAPVSARPKPIEEAPAAPADAQAPACAWAAAGTRFNVSVRLARPLWEPWQPPAQPSRQLTDLFPPRPAPAAPAAPTAADRLRAKVQEIAHELAGQYIQQPGSTCSSSRGSSSRPSTAVSERQQELVFELNSSGKYLAIKQQLRPLLVELVQERYTTPAGRPSTADVQQLHHDLYSNLVQELHAALAEVARQAAEEQQLEQQRSAAGTSQDSVCAQDAGSLQQQDAGQGVQVDPQKAAEALRLLHLAAECELGKDLSRCHDLHLRRIAVLESAEAWHDYGCFCIRSGSHPKAHRALQEALALDQEHAGAASALLCLSLAQALDVDCGKCCPEPTAAETAEVLGHSLKERQGADVVPWALLALLYRNQGKAKETSARSCHQEVLRQSKAAMAAATAAAAAATEPSSSELDGQCTASDSNTSDAPCDEGQWSRRAACDMPAANGYLAAAELALQLNMPGLAHKLLELAASLKDPDGLLTRPLKLAQLRAAMAAGDSQQALTMLREVAESVSADGTDEEKGVMQLLLGDATYQTGNLALAKQHYRRALQKCPQHFTTRTYLQLGECFMRSRDAVVAADMYTACIAAAPTPGTSASAAGVGTQPVTINCGDWVGLAVRTVVDKLVPGRCASMWLKLALAYVRLGDVRSAELALSEGNLCDPEHPVVWGHLALLALQQSREGEASQALKQAQRCQLESPDLLTELGDKYTELGRFDSAADCLARAVVAQDGVKVRCKLAAVLLSQHDYDGCRRQLSAAAQLPATEDEAAMLEDVVRKLQVNWPLL